MWDLLRADEIYSIMFFLSTKDVLRCLQVCKQWKTILSEPLFWRKYIRKRFNINIITDTEELEGPLYQWGSSHWACYYQDQNDAYVIRPFPSTLKCGVVVPFGLNLMSFDTKRLKGLSQSLEILTYMREGVKIFELRCGNECSPNEGCNDLSMVLIPWDGEKLPSKATVFGDIFHFHPEILQGVLERANEPDETSKEEKMYFHADSEHDREQEDGPCLNGIFGRYHDTKEGQLEFFTWLQKTMVPSCTYFEGDGILNPIVEFFLTTLAPGWVGGVLTGQCWT